MKISIITLFPSMFDGPFATSMLRKAQDIDAVAIELVNLRDFGLGPRQTVDDTPYGGGAGMVLKPEPIFAAVESITDTIKKDSGSETPAKTYVVLLSPRGQKYTQNIARDLAKREHIIMICGHYEGIDERVNTIVDAEISLGDFVMTGGEIAAMAVTDSVVRLLPGVLGDDRSAQDESFATGLLEYPHYTRPEEFRGLRVPDELKTGHHAEIDKWRRSEAVKKTQANRPDLTDF